MTVRSRVLIVDDEERVTRILGAVLNSDYEVSASNDPLAALALVEGNFFHVIISDQRMPQMLGAEFLARSKELSPGSMRILLTGYSDFSAVVGSLNEGEIFRFIKKPWRTDELRTIVREAAEISSITRPAASRPLPQLLPGSFQELGDVLVLDTDAEIYAAIHSQKPEFAVHRASSVAEALEILSKFRIAIVVSEMFVGGESTARLLRALKIEYPHILVILASNALDTEGATQLINYVQVFRFVPKPVRLGLLKHNIRSAYLRYREFAATPELTKRYAVAEQEASSDESTGLWGRLRQFIGTLRLAGR